MPWRLHPLAPPSHRRLWRVVRQVRVIKTTTQTSTVPIGYLGAIKMVIEKDGIGGLFFRGLVTKIISNGFQGIMFSVLWRLGQDEMEKRRKAAEAGK